MRPAERVTTIREIAAALSPGEWGDIDLVLKEFGFPTTESWNETSAEYVRTMVARGSDDDLRELHGFLYSQAPSQKQPGTDAKLWRNMFLEGRAFRLFISHTHQHKVDVAALKTALVRHGVIGFVAHEDIEPAAEWQQKIEQALRSCDALLAYLTDDFIESKWTDQEVGVAFGAEKLVVPVRMGVDPYGLIGKLQGVQGVGRDPAALATEIVEIIRTNILSRQTYAEVLVDRLCHAYSYGNARASFHEVAKIPKSLWTSEMAASAREAAARNRELIDGFVGSTTVARAILDLLDAMAPDVPSTA
jgi:hypothetical protein